MDSPRDPDARPAPRAIERVIAMLVGLVCVLCVSTVGGSAAVGAPVLTADRSAGT